MTTIGTLNANSCAREVTVNIRITGARQLAARMWLASILVRLAGVIAGPKVEIDLLFN